MKFIRYLLITTFVLLLYVMIYSNMFYDEDKVFYDEIVANDNYINVAIDQNDTDESIEFKDDGSVEITSSNKNQSVFEIKPFFEDLVKNEIGFIYDDYHNGIVYATDYQKICSMIILASDDCQYPLTNILEHASDLDNYYLFPSDQERIYQKIENIDNELVSNLEILVVRSDLERFKSLYGESYNLTEGSNWQALYNYDEQEKLVFTSLVFVIILTLMINTMTYIDLLKKRKAHILMMINGVFPAKIIFKTIAHLFLETTLVASSAILLGYIFFSKMVNIHYANYLFPKVTFFTIIIIVFSTSINYFCLYYLLKIETYRLLNKMIQIKRGFYTLLVNYGLILFLVLSLNFVGNSGLFYQIEAYIGTNLYNDKTLHYSLLTIDEDAKADFVINEKSYEELLLIGIYGIRDFSSEEINNSTYRIYDLHTFNYLNDTDYKDGVFFLNLKEDNYFDSVQNFMKNSLNKEMPFYYENYNKPVATFQSYDDSNIIIVDFSYLDQNVFSDLGLFVGSKTSYIKNIFDSSDYTDVSFKTSNYDKMYRVKFILTVTKSILLLGLFILAEIMLLRAYLIFYNKKEFQLFINKKNILFKDYYHIKVLIILIAILLRIRFGINFFDLLIILILILLTKIFLHLCYSYIFYKRPKSLEEYDD